MRDLAISNNLIVEGINNKFKRENRIKNLNRFKSLK